MDFRSQRFIHALLLCSLLLGGVHGSAFAVKRISIDRPDILSLPPEKYHPFIEADFRFPELTGGKGLRAVQKAELEAVIALVELYPDREIYFLARDAERLGDMAKLVAHRLKDQKLLNRVHLLNISTKSKDSPFLGRYLTQAGITEVSVRSGKKYLFVDSGFAGNIAKRIQEKFSFAPGQAQIHLISSIDPNLPTSRVFAARINPSMKSMGVVRSYYSEIRGDSRPIDMVKEYAKIPKATLPAAGYESIGSKIIPVSLGEPDLNDGEISYGKAVEMMKDTSAWVNEPETEKLIRMRQSQWRTLLDLYHRGEGEKFKSYAKGLLEFGKQQNDPIYEAVIRDFIEFTDTNLVTTFPMINQIELGLAYVENNFSEDRARLTELPSKISLGSMSERCSRALRLFFRGI